MVITTIILKDSSDDGIPYWNGARNWGHETYPSENPDGHHSSSDRRRHVDPPVKETGFSYKEKVSSHSQRNTYVNLLRGETTFRVLEETLVDQEPYDHTQPWLRSYRWPQV